MLHVWVVRYILYLKEGESVGEVREKEEVEL